jgi:hypothetical protein
MPWLMIMVLVITTEEQYTNNNVLFGGYCWKVIRINGNGTTRMIYNGTPKDAYYTSTALTQAEYLNVTNDATYPYTYDTGTNQWTSTNKTDSTTGTITFPSRYSW